MLDPRIVVGMAALDSPLVGTTSQLNQLMDQKEHGLADRNAELREAVNIIFDYLTQVE